MTIGVERLHWRLDVYQRIFDACAQSGVSPKRFLTLHPERLRLRFGESIRHSQVPIVFAPDLAERLSALLPAATPIASAGAMTLDREALRRNLALAQLDGDLDILDVVGWRGADAFLSAFAAFYGRVLDEARASGAGEETATLFQLVAHSSLRNVLIHRVGATERFLGLAALLAYLSDRALAAAAEKHSDGLSARLGFMLAAACSPLSLMGAATAVVGRPGNAYRTLPSVLAQARAAIREKIDRPGGLELLSLRSRLAAALLVDPPRRRDLERGLLAEAVRDCALLSTLTQGTELRDLGARTPALTEALFTSLGPQKLKARLAAHPRAGQGPLGRLLVLVDSIPALAAGSVEHLARLGSIEERADLAAVGAIVLALDEVTLEQGAEALAMVRPVPAAEADEARQSGRAYWFGFDDQPLYLLPRKREEAFFFVDMKDFTRRTSTVHADAMGDFLRRFFYNPILRVCGHLGRSPQARVAVVNLLGDAVAARGDIVSMMSLSIFVCHQLLDAAKELEQASEALKAGADELLAEIELELARVGARLTALPPGPERTNLELHRRDLIKGRDQRLAKALGQGLEASVFIAFGPQATVIDVGGADVGAWQVTIAEHLNAAARGTGRSASLADTRNKVRLQAEAAQKTQLKDPFRVHTSADPRDLSATTEFHNTGAALTGEALAAYQAARGSSQVFRGVSVSREQLTRELLGFWFPRDREDFMISTDPDGAVTLAFRRTGRTIFRGLEAGGGTDVWEIIPVDSGFGRQLAHFLIQLR